MGLVLLKRTPQPQMVGFCDLVGTGIAPVSTKTAVKYIFGGKS
jgi:hypothetical protein